jgi:hypothetical protein
VDIEVGIDALAGLLAQLTRAFAARRGFSSDGGVKQSYRAVLLCKHSLELTRFSQLCIDVGAPRRRGVGRAWSRAL